MTGKPSLNIDPKLLEPINPVLDDKALEDIEQRLFFTQTENTSPYLTAPESLPTIISSPEEGEEPFEPVTETPLETPPSATSESLLE